MAAADRTAPILRCAPACRRDTDDKRRGTSSLYAPLDIAAGKVIGALRSCIAESFDVFDSTLTADEVAAIDALDTGVRGGPDPETLNRDTYPYVVDNS